MSNNPFVQKVNCHRLLASPLPSGLELFIADGVRCPSCSAALRCDPELLAPERVSPGKGATFRLDCPDCFRTVISVE